MTTLRHLALTAAVIAGSAAMYASPANANPGILNRLAELDARGASRESRVTTSPFVTLDTRTRGVEIAGDPVTRSGDRGASASTILDRLAVLDANGTSRESQITRSPLAARNELIRGVEIAGEPSAASVSRGHSSILNRLHDLSSVSRESSIRY